MEFNEKFLYKVAAFFAIAALLMFLTVSCTQKPGGEQVIPTIDRAGKQITIVVYFYDTSTQVTRVYKQRHNISGDVAPRLGFSMWPEWRDPDGNVVEPSDKPLTCEIHTTRPKRVDDDATLTLGHEMTHCLLGSYHKQQD